MSVRKIKRNNIKIDPDLLKAGEKIDKYTWRLKIDGKLFDVKLHQTKGYSITSSPS